MEQIKSMNAYTLEKGGMTLYFSYKTLIAIKKDGVIYITNQHYSVTTSKQIFRIFNVTWKEMLKDTRYIKKSEIELNQIAGWN